MRLSNCIIRPTLCELNRRFTWFATTGSCYTYVGMENDSKLVLCYHLGWHREQKVTAKRYSPTKFIKAIPKSVWGNPDMDKLCTSHIERLNLSIRTQVKRLARLTLSFSKKAENFAAMMALYFAFYNFIRPHKSLSGATPAMAHGIEKSFWTLEDLLRY